ncbi:MAG: alpha-E domain-containing protein [Nitrospirota bacterium]|nr:alpha-E domain-containing protein [Nitrospirota bacterium]
MLSRAAESFFWIGRYIERAEYTARYTNVKFHLMQEISTREDQQAIWQRYLEGTGEHDLFKELYPQEGTYRFLEFVTTNMQNPNSQVNLIKEARANARSIQDELSSEVWRHLNNFYLTLKSKTPNDLINGPYELLSEIRDTCYTLDGVFGGTMIHDEGWNFYRLGKNVERANRTARLLDDLVLCKAEQEAGDMADYHHCLSILKTASAFEAYRKFYSAELVPRKIVQFLLFHNRFPRSVRFSAGAISSLLERLSWPSRRPEVRDAERLAGQLAADLKYGTLEEVYQTGLSAFLTQIIDQLDTLTNQVAKTFFRSPGYSEIYGMSAQKPQKPLPLVTQPTPYPHKAVLSVQHRFIYQYLEPVAKVTTVVRVLPPQHYGDQKRIDLWWHVDPPADYRHFTDAFGNLVWQLDHTRIEREISCSVDMRVETRALYSSDHSLAWSGLPLHESDGTVQPSEFQQLTSLVNTSDDLTLLVKHTKEPISEPDQLAEALMHQTARHLRYDPESAQVGSTATQVLKTQAGGSQDFVHFMLSLCRQAGLPARFVSGYHLNEKDMYAWVEVLLPLGSQQEPTWVGFDPVHARRCDEQYITVAVGRDYQDVAPTSGYYLGTPASNLTVNVSVILEHQNQGTQ